MTNIDYTPSMFANMTAAEVWDHRRKLLLYGRLIAVVVVALLGIAANMLEDFFVSGLLLIMLTVVVFYVVLARDWQRILMIITQDCDPRKFAEFYIKFLRSEVGAQRKPNNCLGYAQACALAGLTDIAREWVAKVDPAKFNKQQRLVHTNVMANVAVVDHDEELLSEMTDRARKTLGLNQTGKYAGVATSMASYTSFYKALFDGDSETAEQQLDVFDTALVNPQQVLSSNVMHARLELLRGDEDAARPYLDYIAEHNVSCHLPDDLRALMD
ncbi:Uncharacterised protein [Slackia heliotrinireducens]|uniref:Uncharacterized protein n=1 Tax=Slackia heliotrinireducens (strain ATCC 29202 / DSM 20476 / NCTC 11029 / RHS 1) TaxID=471855 RepID=C7N4G6_SLAHD|nr:hypothetical protein [Slackia heliotrinireducens]ACV21801.1 hypothetical protein Shel_07440 [Slackia heliotrinireducens DSM 20476]VEG99499.1 Uncharacterised protein [Slackia heliotrinireducens]